jgi:hypothetical protein
VKPSAQSTDERPIVLCRDHLPEAMITEVDEWIPQHFDDSLQHPAVTSAASFQVAWGLPATFVEPGCRIIIYVTTGMAGLMSWMDSPELGEAIEDGKEREGSVLPVDGDPFTGNIYEVDALRRSAAVDFIAGAGIFIERYEVPETFRSEFDEWFSGPHLDAIAAWPGCTRARTWHQNRDVPDRFPYGRYISKGNRMLWADFSVETNLAELLSIEEVWRTIAESASWDLRLPYARREAGELLVVRSSDLTASA